MNKYQRVMEHVKVDDDMRKRILQNVENELSKESKVVQFGRGTISQIRKHAGMAAMFAILLLGAFAVARITGGITHTTETAEQEAVMEEEAAMTEETAIEEETVMDEDASEPVGSAKTEGEESQAIGQTKPSAAHYIGPILLPIIVIALIALLIWLIIHLIRRRRK